MSGDFREITFQSDTAGNRTFPIKSDEDITFDKGGYRNEFQINGNQTGHDKKNAVPWMLEGVQLEISVEDGDLEYLENFAKGQGGVITWQHVDNWVYKGNGNFQGDMKYNANTGYMPVNIAGRGTAEKIA